MLTEMISKLDRAVLELAIQDAFFDMCLYEGEELIANLENFIIAVENKTTTKEQYDIFFETTIPYIENSIAIYYEGYKGSPKDPADTKEVTVGGDTTGEFNKAQYLKSVGLKVPAKAAKKPLTESEEAEIWEGVGSTIIPSAKAGIDKAKTFLVTSGKKLGDVTTGAIASVAKKISGFKLNKGKTAIAAPTQK